MERKFDYKHRKKGRHYSADPYRLPNSQWPEALKTEFDAYRKWRTDKVVPGRPQRRRQRPNTFAKSVVEFECFFGYLVNTRGHTANSLHLDIIQDSNLLRDYAYWHAKTRADGPSRFIEKTLGSFLPVARHYLKAGEDILDSIANLKAEFKPDRIRDQRERWVSLATLEAIGQAEYLDGQPLSDPVYAALATQRSLIIRLLVRRPMRSRNIREMQLGHNLYREADGWVIEFRGDELKVDWRGNRENIYHIAFPPDLTEQLDEFLVKWRPLLNTNGDRCVFLSRRGMPLSQGALNEQIRKAVYEYTGRATNIHLIRHIWATEYILGTQNFSVAAMVLGDTLETVLRHYAHLLTNDAGKQADKFLDKTLNGIGQKVTHAQRIEISCPVISAEKRQTSDVEVTSTHQICHFCPRALNG